MIAPARVGIYLSIVFHTIFFNDHRKASQNFSRCISIITETFRSSILCWIKCLMNKTCSIRHRENYVPRMTHDWKLWNSFCKVTNVCSTEIFPVFWFAFFDRFEEDFMKTNVRLIDAQYFFFILPEQNVFRYFRQCKINRNMLRNMHIFRWLLKAR